MTKAKRYVGRAEVITYAPKTPPKPMPLETVYTIEFDEPCTKVFWDKPSEYKVLVESLARMVGASGARGKDFKRVWEHTPTKRQGVTCTRITDDGYTHRWAVEESRLKPLLKLLKRNKLGGWWWPSGKQEEKVKIWEP